MRSTHKQSLTVLIPDGEHVLSLVVIQCLAEAQNATIVVLSNNRNIAPRFSKYVTHFYNYKENQLYGEERLKAILEIMSHSKIDVILPVGDCTIKFLSENKERFSNLVKIGLIPLTNVFDVANDKWLFYQWLEKHKINTPSTVLYNGNSNFKDTLKNFKFPVLAKPTNRSGGSGISFFDNSILLEEFLINESIDTTYIVQEYIKGYDLGFNLLAFEGKILAHTIQKPIISSQKKFGPSYGLSFFYDNEIYTIIEDVISKLNWTGVANFDLRYDEEMKHIKIIEMNTRFWGTLISSLMAGVNFPYLSCLACLGVDLPVVKYEQTTCITGVAAYKYWFSSLKSTKKYPRFEHNSIKKVFADPAPYFFKIYKFFC